MRGASRNSFSSILRALCLYVFNRLQIWKGRTALSCIAEPLLSIWVWPPFQKFKPLACTMFMTKAQHSLCWMQWCCIVVCPIFHIYLHPMSHLILNWWFEIWGVTNEILRFHFYTNTKMPRNQPQIQMCEPLSWGLLQETLNGRVGRLKGVTLDKRWLSIATFPKFLSTLTREIQTGPRNWSVSNPPYHPLPRDWSLDIPFSPWMWALLDPSHKREFLGTPR